MRIISDLGYKDNQVKTKQSLQSLTVGRGRRRENYKPDFALFRQGTPRCIIDAKSVDEDPDNWVEQCSGYCLALNRKYDKSNPVRYFVLSNGVKTICYEWDRDDPLIELDFSDFVRGNPKYEHLKSVIGYKTIATSIAQSLELQSANFKFSRTTTARARQLFVTCHKVIWKSEGYGPGPAFLAFVKLMFVKLYADRNLRKNTEIRDLFKNNPEEVKLPENFVMFSTRWIEERESEGTLNPINDMFIQLRNDIEKDIQRRKKKRIFLRDEDLRLRPDTVKNVVRRLQHIDLFGIDEDLNGRLFETFLNATMRGRDLGQFFTPRSVVKMVAQIANIRVDKEYQDKVIDGCCGSGGFLIEALSEMRNSVRANNSFSDREKENLIDIIANDCIYGIDFGQDPPLARVARINMYLHGDGGSHIYYADALDKDVNAEMLTNPETIQNLDELRAVLKATQFDVVLTNPPFSMTKESNNPSELQILKQYDIARRSENSVEIRSSLRSSVMFFERYYDLLKQGGRLITVIDDTILSSSQFSYVRDFIRSRFLIRAIISLPGDTFRRSGSRVKTSVLFLEKRHSDTEKQPDWFYFFSVHLGVDDMAAKASEQDVSEARECAENEMDSIIDGYRQYLSGDHTANVLGPEFIVDRLDLRNCVPLFGRMREQWCDKGIEVKRLSELIKPANSIIAPAELPTQQFTLLKVSYDGYCEVESCKTGNRIKASWMYSVQQGQIIVSKLNASNGAVSIVPVELDGALVSTSSYMVFDCSTECDFLQDAAYLQSVLRSYEIRADIQSLSSGSGRYMTQWPQLGKLFIPWLPTKERRNIGTDLITLWNNERELERQRRGSVAHLELLGVESEESELRWKASKGPQ